MSHFSKTGTYTFDIKENVPQTQAGGMTYDAHTTKVTVNVVRDTEDFAKLKASVSYNSVTAGIATDKATFENSYSSSYRSRRRNKCRSYGEQDSERSAAESRGISV